jgi:hypothetical protein
MRKVFCRTDIVAFLAAAVFVCCLRLIARGSSVPALNVRFMGAAANGRLTMTFSALLKKNYNLMNNIFLAVSITILTIAFTNPTTF